MQAVRAVQLSQDGSGVESGKQRSARLAQMGGKGAAGAVSGRTLHPPRAGRGRRRVGRAVGDRGDSREHGAERSPRNSRLRPSRERLVQGARSPPEARVDWTPEGRKLHPKQRNAERVRQRRGGAEVAVPHIDGGHDGPQRA